jgi:hypothetical protein
MPVIKFWCLPSGQSQKKLEKFYQAILEAVVSIKGLGLTKKGITVLFPTDHMIYGLGDEIIIEIGWLFVKEERTATVKRKLSLAVAMSAKMLYPKAKVECKVETIDPEKDAFCVLPAAARPNAKKKVLMCIDKVHECKPTGGPECASCGG